MTPHVLVIGLLLLGFLPVRAEMMRYQGRDGRLYFTNAPPVRRQTLPTSSRSAPPWRQVASVPPTTLRLIHELAQQHDIEPRLVRAIIRVESNFNPRAISRTGARGLMQLMPATVERYQVGDPFNPRANIEGGIRYLKDLMRQFPKDIRWVLAAYNAGEQAVYQYGGIPPYAETQRYVKRVLALYSSFYPARKIYRYQTPNGGILFTDVPR